MDGGNSDSGTDRMRSPYISIREGPGQIMPRRISLVLVAASLALSACVTARMHSEAELADVGRECGLAVGELFQDESEKRLLFLFRVQPSPEQRLCVVRWARKNKLRTVFVDAINFPEES